MKQFFTLYEELKMAAATNAELPVLSDPRNLYPEGLVGLIQESAYADMILANVNPLENLDIVLDAENIF